MWSTRIFVLLLAIFGFQARVCLADEVATRSSDASAKYNLSGQVEKIVIKDTVITTSLAFDAAGRLLEEKVEIHASSKQNKRGYKTVYSHDPSFSRSTSVTYLKTGAILNRGHYWHGAGPEQLFAKIISLPSGVIDHGVLNSYDGTGKLTTQLVLAKNQLASSTHFVHDSGKRETREFHFEGGNTYQHEVRRLHDQEGHVVRMDLHDAAGNLVDRFEYKYDRTGNETEKVAIAGNGIPRFKEVTTYEYDVHGNWTKLVRSRFESKGSDWILKKEYVQERAISYYEPDRDNSRAK